MATAVKEMTVDDLREMIEQTVRQTLEDYLDDLRFTPQELEWLAGCGRFRREFVDRLATFRFTGDVHAMPEGTVFFPEEHTAVSFNARKARPGGGARHG